MRLVWITALGMSLALDAMALTADESSNSLLPSQFLKRTRAAIQDEPRLSLRDELPLGAYAVQADALLDTLAPHLRDSCNLVLAGEQTSGQTIHERYELRCMGLLVAYSGLKLHLHQAKLTVLNAELPDVPPPEFIAAQLWQTHLQEVDGYEISSMQRSLYDHGGNALAPAYLAEATRLYDQLPVEILVDAETFAVVSELPRVFSISRVYSQNPQHGQLESVQLPSLKGTGYLDGKDFIVYAPTESHRLQSADSSFAVNPTDNSTWEFDQVQAYFGATKALAWLKARFNYDPGAEPIVISVHDTPRGRADNAEYRADNGKPKILIGIGTEQVNGLARDNDVVTHELAHHVIFRSLKSTYGESGALHEGTADYFAYALYENPFLAESIMPGAPYIRTALLEADQRIDNPNLTSYTHYRGQIWSATLWSLRKLVGDRFDQVVYSAIDYLSWNSGYSDAIVALLNADRDHHPLPAADPYHGIYGTNYCAIFDAVVARGYATFIETLDPGNCPLKLTEAAAESRAYTSSLQPEGKKDSQSVGFELFGRKCSVIFGQSTATSTKTLLALVLLLPLLLPGVANYVPRKGHSLAPEKPDAV